VVPERILLYPLYRTGHLAPKSRELSDYRSGDLCRRLIISARVEREGALPRIAKPSPRLLEEREIPLSVIELHIELDPPPIRF
jgi:hypothetical protein